MAWEHQPPAIDYLNRNSRVLLDAHMGTGKSFITVNHCQSRFSERDSRILILCPSPVLGVWRREFWKHGKEMFDLLVLDGSQASKKKAELVSDFVRLAKGRLRPSVIAVNYETFWRPEMLKALRQAKFAKAICDESHRIKSHSSRTSKDAHSLAIDGIGSRLCLTGTPMANGPQDIFGQYRFLNDSIFGRWWTHFKRRYAIENPNIPGMIVKWINQDEFREKVNSIRYHIGPEVLSLPDKQDVVVHVDLDRAGRKAYDAMRKEAFVELGLRGDSVSIASAANGAVQFLRLLQLAQGYIKDNDGVEQQTDTAKRRALLELLEDIDEPVVVYGWFKHDIACVRRCAEILGRRFGELSGDRSDLTPHATMPDGVDIFAVQCKSGSAGVDLTRSRLGIILNSGLLSPGDYDQMLARQYRPGQTKNVVFTHLVSRNTVETKLIDSRGKKNDIIAAMLSDIQNPEEETPW